MCVRYQDIPYSLYQDIPYTSGAKDNLRFGR